MQNSNGQTPWLYSMRICPIFMSWTFSFSHQSVTRMSKPFEDFKRSRLYFMDSFRFKFVYFFFGLTVLQASQRVASGQLFNVHIAHIHCSSSKIAFLCCAFIVMPTVDKRSLIPNTSSISPTNFEIFRFAHIR